MNNKLNSKEPIYSLASDQKINPQAPILTNVLNLRFPDGFKKRKTKFQWIIFHHFKIPLLTWS